MHLEKNKNNFSQNELSKNEKLIKNIWELLLLIVDLYDEGKGYEKIPFNNIIKFIVQTLIDFYQLQTQNYSANTHVHSNNSEFLNLFEEIITKSNLFLANLASVKCLKISENNYLEEFMVFSFKFLQEFQNRKQIFFANNNAQNNNFTHNYAIQSFINSALTNTLFYLFCANNEIPMNLNLGNLISKLFENVDFTLSKKVIDVNDEIQNFVKNLNKDDKKDKSDNMITDEVNTPISPNNINNINTVKLSNEKKEELEKERLHNMKQNLKLLDTHIKLNNLNLRTINDIITQFEGNMTKAYNINLNEDELEVSADEEDINISYIADEKTEIEKKICAVINNNFFLNDNVEQLKNLLNVNFINNLCGFFNNLTIEEFLLNDFDKMIIIKEGLFELEYNTLSILNNLIYNFDGFFGNRL